MEKMKLVDMEIPAYKYDETLTLYLRLGFELVDSKHYSGVRFSGTENNLTPHEYDYYKCLFKFNMEQKNAQKLWENYKKYKKKNKELKLAYDEKAGDPFSWKLALILAVIICVLATPCIPMINGNDFGYFYHNVGFLFDTEIEFDYLTFGLSIFMGFLIGIPVGLIVEGIRSALLRKKLMVEAIEKIPRLQKEIEDLVLESQNLL